MSSSKSSGEHMSTSPCRCVCVCVCVCASVCERAACVHMWGTSGTRGWLPYECALGFEQRERDGGGGAEGGGRERSTW